MIIVCIILTLLVIASAIYYFEFYKKGKINDRDGDFIPDEIEDTIENVKAVAKETKRRAKNVKKEIKDVVDAVKGKKRKGRKPRAKK
tara:strand:- start:245 stop:505 length:261 start_codon:yes stop_codon:yes gene_type:complete